MLLTCPSCGCKATASAWENDADARAFMGLLIKMPKAVQVSLFGYCNLFKVPGSDRAMSWKKAVRIASELQELVSAGFVETKGSPARPAPPDVWGDGIDQMVSRAEVGALRLPIPNHNYLKKVVWDIADHRDARSESASYHRAVSGNGRQPDTHVMTHYEGVRRDNADAPVFQLDGNGCVVGQVPRLSQFDRAYIEAHGEAAFAELEETGRRVANRHHFGNDKDGLPGNVELLNKVGLPNLLKRLK